MRGVHRIFYIGFGVVCLHAAILWRIPIGSEPIMAATPIFMLQMTPTLPTPQPVSTPTANPAAVAKTPSRQKIANLRPERPVSPEPQEDVPVVDTPRSVPDKVENQATASGSHATPSVPTQSAPGKFEMGSAQTGPATAALPPSLQLPSSAADYLNNPAPVYPAISQRLGEQGKVVIRVLITKDGSARQAEIQESSGFDRLDQAALRAVMGWRYVPGRRTGVPQDMWFNVPINFALK